MTDIRPCVGTLWHGKQKAFIKNELIRCICLANNGPTTTSRKRTMKKFFVRSIPSLFLALTWAGALVYLLLSRLMPAEHNPVQLFDRSDPQLHSANMDLVRSLGFVEQPSLYPQSYHDKEWPVVVSAVSKDNMESFFEFMQNFHVYLDQRKLVVYSLSLSDEQKLRLRASCFCVIRDVYWSKYPAHIADLSTGAYRPILLQEALHEFGSVLWCDPEVRINAYLYESIEKAHKLDLVAWSVPWPTSSFTHYNTFRFFNVSWSQYYFHRMVDPGRMLIYNTEFVHKKIMLPWIQCVLDRHCISPIGSQSVGCNFHQKPKYIYTGCHNYATSALNVILGSLFKFETPYLGKPGVLTRVQNMSSQNQFIGLDSQHAFFHNVKVI